MLAAVHGSLRRPPPRGPFGWVLWENVAYLVADDRRETAWRALERATALDPQRIAQASAEKLLAVTRLGGMHPEARVERLKTCADIALALGGGDLARLRKAPRPEALKALRRFPGIGAPGAARILMFCGDSTELALESNGLRALVRLGFGSEEASYDKTYRSVQAAIADEIGHDAAWLTRAHRLLRAHGMALCKSSAPSCDECPLESSCAWAARERAG